MRVVQFCKWWWKNNDGFNRSIILSVIWMILGSPFAAWMAGPYGLAVLFATYAGLCAVFWILHTIGIFIKESWIEFTKENPTEEQKIISKLRGDDLT